MRMRAQPPVGGVQVLGWDAVGLVESVGADVTLFRPGETVFYAGSIARPGTNAALHLVDERIVGHAPASFSRRGGCRPATDRHHGLGVTL